MEGILAEGSRGKIYGDVTAANSSEAAGPGSEGRRGVKLVLVFELPPELDPGDDLH